MELNLKLPSEYSERLKGFTDEVPVYCVHPDIDLSGQFT
jgi:hypothetical protein